MSIYSKQVCLLIKNCTNLIIDYFKIWNRYSFEHIQVTRDSDKQRPMESGHNMYVASNILVESVSKHLKEQSFDTLSQKLTKNLLTKYPKSVDYQYKWGTTVLQNTMRITHTYIAIYTKHCTTLIDITVTLAMTNFNSFIAIFKGSVSPSSSTITGAFMLQQ